MNDQSKKKSIITEQGFSILILKIVNYTSKLNVLAEMLGLNENRLGYLKKLSNIAQDYTLRSRWQEKHLIGFNNQYLQFNQHQLFLPPHSTWLIEIELFCANVKRKNDQKTFRTIEPNVTQLIRTDYDYCQFLIKRNEIYFFEEGFIRVKSDKYEQYIMIYQRAALLVKV